MAAFSFAHLSDPHLSSPAGITPRQLLNKRLLGYLAWRRRRQHEHSPRVIDALRRDLILAAPDHVAITGDLTHLGLPHEFRQVRRWLDSLHTDSVSLVPGNHDSYVAQDWGGTYRHWLPYLTPETSTNAGSLDALFPTLRVLANLAFIGLSSALPTAPLLASGRLGQRQLDSLADMLAQCRERRLFRVLMLHHPPLPGQIKWRKGLRDAGALMTVVRREGAELILHGHSHRSEQREIEARGKTIPVLGVPSASARGWHGEIARYNQLRLEADAGDWRLTVASRHFDDVEQGFVAATTREWRIRA